MSSHVNTDIDVPDEAYRIGHCTACGSDFHDFGIGPFCANEKCPQSFDAAELHGPIPST